jgi:hypothetical protein
MKTRSNIYLPIAAMILTGALALAEAPKQVPFKGTLHGDDVDTLLSPTTGLSVTTGMGIGTHIGQFSFRLENTFNLANLTATGSAHWIAANGDSFDTTSTGFGEPTDTPNILSITETHTITGGTGRFAGAQGSFIVERLGNAARFTTAGSFHGTITSLGADH